MLIDKCKGKWKDNIFWVSFFDGSDYIYRTNYRFIYITKIGINNMHAYVFKKGKVMQMAINKGDLAFLKDNCSPEVFECN